MTARVDKIERAGAPSPLAGEGGPRVSEGRMREVARKRDGLRRRGSEPSRFARPPSSVMLRMTPLSERNVRLTPARGEGKRVFRFCGRGRPKRARRDAFPASPDVEPRKLFPTRAKHFQICGLFLQVFPKIPSSVSWKIKGLRAEKGKFRFPPNFLRRNPSESPRPAPPAGGISRGATTRNVARFSFFRKTKLQSRSRSVFVAPGRRPRRAEAV